MIQDYVIHRFIRERGGKATKKEVLEALGRDEESKRLIEEKMMMMARFGILSIDGDVVEVTKKG